MFCVYAVQKMMHVYNNVYELQHLSKRWTKDIAILVTVINRTVVTPMIDEIDGGPFHVQLIRIIFYGTYKVASNNKVVRNLANGIYKIKKVNYESYHVLMIQFWLPLLLCF